MNLDPQQFLSGPESPSEQQNYLVAQTSHDLDGLRHTLPNWNFTACHQISLSVPGQAVPLFGPQPHYRSEPGSRLIPTGYAASSDFGQSATADIPWCTSVAGRQSPANEQSFPQNFPSLPQPRPIAELAFVPISHGGTTNNSFLGLGHTFTAGAAVATPHSQKVSRRCVKCWALKKSCKTDDGESRCSHCVKFKLPVQFCSRERLTEHKPFEKWKDQTYELLFTVVRSSTSSSRTSVDLRHIPNGPTLTIECYEFLPTYPHQTRVLHQDSSGWHSAKTTAYCLTNPKVDVSAYVQSCVSFALSEACAFRRPVALFFQLAQRYQSNPIIRQCLEMYTTLRVMRMRWRFSGHESLGTAAIKDQNSPWYGFKPVPRMIQNQLGHRLEFNLIDLDKKILKAVHNLMGKNDRGSWIVVTLAVFLLLHIRELDAGRNIFWSRHGDPLKLWIHPSKPKALIDEATYSSNSLLSHFHCVIGRKPFDLDWDDQRSKAMVNNNLTIVNSMKVLQAGVSHFRKAGVIGRRACDLYKDGDPFSVSFTISSLMFESKDDGCEVKGFF